VAALAARDIIGAFGAELARSEPIKMWRLPRCHAELNFERHDDLSLAYSIVIGSA
jgi:hypothetical protein